MEKPKSKNNIWEQIKDHRKDPRFVKAVKDFIRATTS